MYRNSQELPKLLKIALPSDAQDLYVEAFNQAWRKHRDTPTDGRREALAHQAGWQAVEEEFVHDETQGRWYRREESDETAEDEQSILGKIKSIVN